MEKKLLEAFDAVHMDDRCIGKIKSAMAEKSAAPRAARRPLRLAIAAACLCLLLPITVLGVGQLPGKVSLGDWISNTDETSYKVVADTVQWSMDSFSDVLRTDLENGTLQQVHNDKEELEAYLGVSLISSPALEEAGIVEDLAKSIDYGWDYCPELTIDPSARYILTASNLDGSAAGADPQVLKVSCHRVMENSEIYLSAWIITDAVTPGQLEDGILMESFSPVTVFYLEFPRDADGNFLLDEKGIPTVELKEFTSAEQKFTSQSYPMPNGDTATIITAQSVEHDGSLGFQEYLGCFIHDGILYTVKPYAIDDPNLSYPTNDYDMLAVLQVVLDTFA